jgi:Ca2+-binding RTX toxin-like protein
VIAVVTLLATAGGAAAGQLEIALDDEGNPAFLDYRHLARFEPFQAHDVVIEDNGDGRFRLTDEGAKIHFCGAPPLCIPPDAVCDPGPTDNVAICDPVPFRAITGPFNDRFVNHTAMPLLACGGEGNDVLTGGAGRDTLGGGPGRDELRGRGGNDSLAVDLGRQLNFDPDASPLAACLAGSGDEPFELLDGGDGNDHLEGGPAGDRMIAGAGHDSAYGFGGNDILDGGGGLDDLSGFEGDDVLDGGGDSDFLFGGPGNDDLDGGPGDDDLGRTLRIDADGLGTGTAVGVFAEDGDDRLDGGEGDDVMIAGPGESLFDLTGSVLVGRTGVATDPRLRSAALNGADRYTGGPGEDLVSYANRDLPVSITPLDGVANDGSAGEGDRVDADFERYWGGTRGDVLNAPPGGATILGDLGPDRLLGGPGPDRLSGGIDDSADTIAGAGGDDQMAGGPGDDALDGGPGADVLLAGGGNDAVAGGDGDDRIEGSAGADRLDGGAGTDCVHGFLLPLSHPGCDTGLPPTTVAGADGGDSLRGGAGVDRLYGGDGDDVVDYSTARRRVVVALPGSGARAATDDVLAADVEGVRGGFGPDVLLGNAADNMLDGGPGDDHVQGGDGVDRLRGGSGQDFVVARDGEPDAVRCGTKRDLALIDGDDELVAALSDICESVDGGGSSLGRSLAPIGDCTLGIRPPGGTRTFALGMRASLPAGTIVDTSSCAARIGRGRVRGGAFKLQPAGRRLRLRLHGGRAGKCRSGLRVRRLVVHRAPAWLAVRGRDLTASGAGASWTTIDGCRGTRIKVRSGDVRTKR